MNWKNVFHQRINELWERAKDKDYRLTMEAYAKRIGTTRAGFGDGWQEKDSRMQTDSFVLPKKKTYHWHGYWAMTETIMDVKTEIRGCAVLTAESLMDNLQLSSRLRLLVVPFTETSIDNEVLAAFQEDRLQSERTGCPATLDLYKASFIRFVEHHFTELIQFISEFLPPPLQLRFSRQVRIYKILATVAAIVVRFLEECGTLSGDDGARLLDESLIPALQDLLHYNESLHVAEDPIKLFLRAVASGVGLNLIDIATDKDEFFKRAKTAIGFWDDQILKLDPRRTYRYVSGVYAAQRFTATGADIWAALRDKKISEGYFDKKKGMASLFKKIQVNGVTTEMLCLRWDKVEEILNESRLDEKDIEE